MSSIDIARITNINTAIRILNFIFLVAEKMSRKRGISLIHDEELNLRKLLREQMEENGTKFMQKRH